MSSHRVSTRRRFLSGAGATLSAPLAATAALATGGVPTADTAARLARLEDMNAIRALQREYARLVNAGAHVDAARLFVEPAAALPGTSLRRLAADRFAPNDAIEVAPDGASATAVCECTVETEIAIAGSYTLVDMLREQGEASLRSVERRVLEGSYVKQGGVWKIASLALRRG